MNRKVSGGWLFLLIIPIGMIILFFLYDFGAKVYFENKLDKDTLEIFTKMMDREGLETDQEYRDFIKTQFKEKGVTLEDLSLVYDGDKIIIITYRKYMSIVGTLSFGFVSSKDRLASSSYIGYYNDYKETVIEKFKEKVDEEDIA